MVSINDRNFFSFRNNNDKMSGTIPSNGYFFVLVIAGELRKMTENK